MIKKIIFFLAWVGIFLASLVGINYVFMPNSLAFSDIYLRSFTNFEIRILVLVLAIVYLFLSIYKFLSLFETNKDFIKKTENGSINISQSTVNNFVSDLLKNDSTLSNSKVSSRKQGKKVVVEVKTSVVLPIKTMDKISSLQEMIKKGVLDYIGIEVNEVKINILKVSGLSPYIEEEKKETTTENEVS